MQKYQFGKRKEKKYLPRYSMREKVKSEVIFEKLIFFYLRRCLGSEKSNPTDFQETKQSNTTRYSRSEKKIHVLLNNNTTIPVQYFIFFFFFFNNEISAGGEGRGEERHQGVDGSKTRVRFEMPKTRFFFCYRLR